MKTIICGGRDYSFSNADFALMDQLKDSLPITEIVSGGAKGADAYGEIWARLNCMPVTQFPANWNLHGKSAGPIRNAQMAAYSDAVVAFPGGTGTADMVRRAKANGLKVIMATEAGAKP